MFWTILSVCIILFAPAGIIFLTKKVKFFAVIGAVALCYALGIILGVCGLPFDKELGLIFDGLEPFDSSDLQDYDIK